VTGARRRAREAALQILYFWEIGRTDPDSALSAFFEEHGAEADATVRGFAAALVKGTAGEVVALDRLIEQHSDHWRVERLAVVDRLILRLATWELLHEPDIPRAVVLNEAVEIARRFSTDESVRFVNGVLDAIRKTLEQSGSVAPDAAP
jgi:N utilization substance protein B